jgi:hypothetical protein
VAAWSRKILPSLNIRVVVASMDHPHYGILIRFTRLIKFVTHVSPSSPRPHRSTMMTERKVNWTAMKNEMNFGCDRSSVKIHTSKHYTFVLYPPTWLDMLWNVFVQNVQNIVQCIHQFLSIRIVQIHCTIRMQ